ncbi:hypothetical protein [Mesorhizobium sp. INR15]|uniref:hypothetical protein n=1 Tax=Mesorhizobium sp. INR15 TaxID=2654248 RepID=UPI00189681BC|nr:hypothetical protein [Mesorhizobium sp. INR15]QPC89380.1 hypothetical protein GA829_01555 [Mesorhizobium sp. INR15]
MPEAERGPGWTKGDGGRIFYRMSRWSPTYVVSQKQFDRLRSHTNSEWILAWSTIVVPAVAFFAWWQDFTAISIFVYCLVGYCIVNSVFSVVCWQRRQQILRGSGLANEPVVFLSPSHVVSRAFSGLNVWQKRRLFLVVLCVVIGSLFSLSQSFWGISLGSVNPIHPVAAALGLLIFVPMLVLLISYMWLGRFTEKTNVEDRGG